MDCKSCDKETSIRNVEGDCPDCECIKGQSKIIKTQAERITELEGAMREAIQLIVETREHKAWNVLEEALEKGE